MNTNGIEVGGLYRNIERVAKVVRIVPGKVERVVIADRETGDREFVNIEDFKASWRAIGSRVATEAEAA